jgi:osmotically-inducible protein OsmY
MQEREERHGREALLRQVEAAIEHDARIDMQTAGITVSAGERDGAVRLSGVIADLCVKKQALRAAAGVAGVGRVVDELRLAADDPPPGDGATRDAVCKWLLRDIDFQNCRIAVRGDPRVLREAGADSAGSIEITVDDGVVTLSGQVISLSHRRLAGVLAWWSRGCRDVVNQLAIVPPERDSDEEIVEALRLVFETDPNLHAEQIGISCSERAVTLSGAVVSASEKTRAETDAWCLDGVEQVINHIDVLAPA